MSLYLSFFFTTTLWLDLGNKIYIPIDQKINSFSFEFGRGFDTLAANNRYRMDLEKTKKKGGMKEKKSFLSSHLQTFKIDSANSLIWLLLAMMAQ